MCHKDVITADNQGLNLKIINFAVEKIKKNYIHFRILLWIKYSPV